MKILLFLLNTLIAATASISGLLMISSPDGGILNLSIKLLHGTPFRNFLIPGIILTGIIGGINLIAVAYNISRNRNRYNWALAGGIITSVWIIIQIIMIQAMYWLQFLYLGAGILIALIAYQLKGKWAV